MICRSYIAGHWADGVPAPALDRADPADSHLPVSRTIVATAADVRAAAHAAAATFQDWAAAPVEVRCGRMRALAALIRVREEDFARTITAETGKTLAEAAGEVKAAIAEIEAALAVYKVDGGCEVGAGYRLSYRALGTVLVISPFNFPLASVIRKLVPALLAGNGALVKVSELTPLTSVMLFELLDRLDLPRGLVSLLLGDGAAILRAALDGPELAAITVTGSTATGDAIAAAIGCRNIRLQAETGGSNPVIVMADADLDRAAADITAHAFACAGQWCTGTRRVIVEAPVRAALTGLLLERIAALRVGAGSDPATGMGALVSFRQRDAVAAAVARLRAGGATCLAGGEKLFGAAFDFGCFMAPTLLADLLDYDTACRDEIFGPVLLLASAGDAEEAVALANRGHFGLSAAVYTSDEDRGTALAGRIAAGLVHLNLPTGYRDMALPLTGWRQSGRGIPEGGRFGRDFFTRPQTLYRPARSCGPV